MKLKTVLAGRPRRFRMFVVIIGQAAIDDQEVDFFGMRLDQVGEQDRIAVRCCSIRYNGAG